MLFVGCLASQQHGSGTEKEKKKKKKMMMMMTMMMIMTMKEEEEEEEEKEEEKEEEEEEKKRKKEEKDQTNLPPPPPQSTQQRQWMNHTATVPRAPDGRRDEQRVPSTAPLASSGSRHCVNTHRPSRPAAVNDICRHTPVPAVTANLSTPLSVYPSFL